MVSSIVIPKIWNSLSRKICFFFYMVQVGIYDGSILMEIFCSAFEMYSRLTMQTFTVYGDVHIQINLTAGVKMSEMLFLLYARLQLSFLGGLLFQGSG